MERKRFLGGLLSLFFWSLMLFGFSGEALADESVKDSVLVPSSASKEVDKATKLRINASYGKFPLYFIENEGQVDEKVRFYEKGGGHSTFFTKEGVYLSLCSGQRSSVRNQKTGEPFPRQDTSQAKEGELTANASTEIGNTKHATHKSQPESFRSELIKLMPINANKDPEIIAEGLQEGKINYLIGNDPSRWKTNIPTYRAVVYKEIYPGIDIRFYGDNRQLEYDIIVKPGADPSRVRFAYEGIERLSVTQEGDLEIIHKQGKLIQKKPYIYQEIGGKKVKVDGAFLLKDDIPENDKNQEFVYGFKVASYDANHPVIIDPVLVYSTYLGGSNGEVGFRVAVDTSGNAYITGYTYSTDFPVASPIQGIHGNEGTYADDAFVTKIDASGTSLIYSTYLGGNDEDSGEDIAVDTSGNAYIIGRTASTDFPVASPIQGSNAGSVDTFVTKIDPSGSILIYSTYLGGSSNDYGYGGIAVDTSGNAYIGGQTNSTDFPVASPIQGSNAGNYDVFVTKIDASGTSLIYSTYLGGSGDRDGGRDIAVDASGNAYLTGETNSTDFPVASPIQGSKAGYDDAFVAKIDSSGTSLIYSTYLGGGDTDRGGSIALDTSGNAYITGRTWSTDFPVVSPIQGSNAGSLDTFITKIDASGTSLIYSTYLGGSDWDYGSNIALDTFGNAYITGWTESTDFPVASPIQGTYGGGTYGDAFVTKIDASGLALTYSTYLGGSDSDAGHGIAVDTSGNAYITGRTESTDFPVVSPIQGSNAGLHDAFVAKIIFPPAEVPKTGQTTVYAAGDDGDIQAGVPWPDPRFTDNGDGTVTDNLTGLMWTMDANLPGSTMTWQEALDYVSGMNAGTYNNFGYTDWRLSNINELESLIDAEEYSPALPTAHPFTNVQGTSLVFYWSSTSYSQSPDSAAWIICLQTGWVYSGSNALKSSDSHYVWPVRTGQSTSIIQLPKTSQTTSYASGDDGDIQAGVPWPDPRFTDNEDGTVTDNLTGLVWNMDANLMATRDPGFDTDDTLGDGLVIWQHALDYVTQLNAEAYLGYTDWRLPNKKELLSLVDRSLDNPTLPAGYAFTNVPNYFWSSTTLSSSAWWLDLYWGQIMMSSKTNNYNAVWPVRGGTVSPPQQTVTVPDVVGMTQANAEADIISVNLTVGTITQQNSSTVPVGDVISQDPLAGTSVPEGSAVNLVISLGPSEFVIHKGVEVEGVFLGAWQAEHPYPNPVGTLTTSRMEHVLGSIDPNYVTTFDGSFTADPSPTFETVDVLEEGVSVSCTVTGAVSGVGSLNGTQMTIQTGSYQGYFFSIWTYDLAGYTGTVYGIGDNDQDWWGMAEGDINGVYHQVGNQGTLDITSINSVQDFGTINIAWDNITTNSTTPYSGVTLQILDGISIAGTASGLYNGPFQDSGTTLWLQLAVPYPARFFGTYQTDAGSGRMLSCPTIVPAVSVPDVAVVGMTQADAETAIVSANLTVGTITQQYSATVPAGDVISQDPAAGTPRPEGSAVDLVVSLGPPPPPPSITTSSLPDGLVGSAYNQTLSATGGVTPYTWSIISGTLPAGLSLNSSTGQIFGTPTTEGVSNFTVQVTDDFSNTDTKGLSISVLVATFSDDFDDPTTYMLPVNPNTLWRQVGTSWGTFDTDVGSGGTGLSVQLVDNTDPSDINGPSLAAQNAQYFDLSSVVVQVELRSNNASPSGGIEFSVYDDTGENKCGTIVASLGTAGSEWVFSLVDWNEYDQEGVNIIDLAFVPIDPSQFHLITMQMQDGVVSATLDGRWTVSGTPRLPIDVGWIGLWANASGDFCFDNFSMTAQPDNRHVVFKDVAIVSDPTATADANFPSLSHDGKKVAYVQRDGTDPGSWNVWVRQVDPPAAAIQITQNSDNAWIMAHPEFSPNCNYVIFNVQKAGGGMEIRKAKVDGTGNVEIVLSDPQANYYIGDVNPSNNFLSGSKEPYSTWQCNLFSVQVNDNGDPIAQERTLTNFPPSSPIPVDPNFDEAHNRLVFACMTHASPTDPALATSDLYVLNGVQEILAGTDLAPTSYSDIRLVPIATGPNFQCLCKFSLDGSLVYYSEDVNGAFDWKFVRDNPAAPLDQMLLGQHWEIFAVNPDDLVERIKLNYYRPYNQGLLDASHDGTKLVFSSDNRADNDGVVDGDIYMVTLKVQEEIVASQDEQIVDGSGTTLDIPAGSVSEDTTISIKTPLPGDIPSPDTLPEGLKNIALARVIELESETATIINPLTITIHYTDEEISGLDELSLRIYIYNEDLVPPSWEPLPNCTVDPVANTVSAPVTHLSTFVISSGVTTTGLVAYYPFNGNANDASGNGYDGIVNGATLTQDRFGNPDSAYSFDGIDDYVQANNSESMFLENFSVHLWVKLTDLADVGVLISKGQSGSDPSQNQNFEVEINVGGIVHGQYEYGNNDTTSVYSNSIIEDNLWHQVALTYDGSVLNLYIDGVLDSYTASTNLPDTINPIPLIIGDIGELDTPIQCILDDIRIYDRALSEPEIQALYSVGGAIDSDSDGLPDDLENTMCTDPNDADTDNDGIPDGTEDANPNGVVDTDETDPCNIDTDGDGIQDGTESGYTLSDIGPDTDTNIFQPDLDPASTTNPLNPDTDGDGISDGQEDANHNGRVDSGESDPNQVNQAPSLVWKKTSSLYLESTPALGDDGVFYLSAGPTYGGNNFGIAAIDPLDGSVIWGPVIPSGCSYFGESGLSIGENGIVYATGDWNPCGDGKLVALDSINGSILWVHNTASSGYSPHPRHAPALNETLNDVYFGSTYLYSVDMTSGNDNWVNPGGYQITYGSVAIDSAQNVYYGTITGTGGDSRLLSYTSNGQLRWQRTFSGITSTIKGIVAGDIIVANRGSSLVALDTNGNDLWQVDDLDGTFVTDASGNIYSQRLGDAEIACLTPGGTELWRARLPNATWAEIDFADNSGHVYARGDNVFYAINCSGGSIAWSFTADADFKMHVGTGLTPGGRIFLSDIDANIYLFDTSLDYAQSAWPIAEFGNRRHTQKAWDTLPLPQISTNTPPTLSYSSETGYVSDGVNPDSGPPSTSFTYKVVYTDADNEAPTFVYLHIDAVTTASMLLDTSALDPAFYDGDYTNGEQYYYIASPAVGSHNYYFTASDGTVTARLPSSGTLSGPDVSGPPPPVSITTTSLPDGAVGAAYSQTLSATGGVLPYGWSISSGGLPAGLNLNPSTGEISGTPTTEETASFTVQVQDANLDTDTQGLSIDILPEPPPGVYEDAEDGTTDGWSIFDDDPPGATITNVPDAERGSRVIELSGDGTSNCYELRNSDGTNWNNTSQFIIEWSMRFSAYFHVLVDVKTSSGRRMMCYTPDDYDLPGNETYLHHGLGSNIMDGNWHTITRDLQADLQDVQPGVSITEVNGMIICGSGMLDDIILLSTVPALSVSDVTVAEDGSSALFTITASPAPSTDITVDYATADGTAVSGSDYVSTSGTATIAAGTTTTQVYVPIINDTEVEGDETFVLNLSYPSHAVIADGTGVATITDDINPDVPTVYEDGEDSTTDGWTVFDNDPPGSTISNVYDDDRKSQVIEFSGDGKLNSYRLSHDDGSNWNNTSQFIIEWSMRFSEDFNVLVDVKTSAGRRMIYYTPDDNDLLGDGVWVHHGLGSGITDGQWHTITRDLEADLQEAQPGVSILEVNGLIICGSGKVDDITLLRTVPQLSVNDVTIAEDGGTAEFTIMASLVPTTDITVYYSTGDGTAVSGSDYISTTGTATIVAGTNPALVKVNVPIVDDAEVEGDEAFVLNLSYPSHAVIVDGTGVATITDEVIPGQATVYEDAEDGTTDGWTIFDNDPPGASISNVNDDPKGLVIEFSGDATKNSYNLRNDDGSNWNNTSQFVIEWSMRYSENFSVLIDTRTSAGRRMICYTQDEDDLLGDFVWVHHGLGSSIMDGQWHTITRDLEADLQDAQPGVNILEVNGMIICGSGKVDDVKLSQ